MNAADEATDTSELIRLLFDQSYSPSEPYRRWAAHAWRELARQGRVPEEVELGHPDYADHLLTMATMAYILNTVAEIFAGQDPDQDWAYPRGLDDPCYGAQDITVGRWAERLEVIATGYPESRFEILSEVLSSHAWKVVPKLAEAWGNVTVLAASIFALKIPWTEMVEENGCVFESERDVCLPLSDEDFAEVMRRAESRMDGVGASCDALGWLEARSR